MRFLKWNIIFTKIKVLCGILGIKINTSFEEFDKNRIKKGLEKIHHRGPDHSDYKFVAPYLFGHTRLSVIDTSTAGHQPMTKQEDQYTLVFNGEIYNFQDLKNDLLSKGYRFESQSDTEVLLNYLIEYGEQGISSLNGCFAFAFYDQKKRKLILARDPMGINPLFYHYEKNEFAFASNIKAIASIAQQKLNFSDQIPQYFKFGYTPGTATLFEGIEELAPGHCLLLNEKHEISIQKIMPTLPKDIFNHKKRPETTLRSLLENAVLKRLKADVPLGCFLSGGVDSSIISALAFKHKTDVNTFSIGIGDQAYYDESRYAEQVAQHIGTAHQTIKITENDFQERYDDIMDAFEFPFADASAINLFFLCEATRKNVTVALSGDGADELFGGYRKHIAFQNTTHRNFKTWALDILYPLSKLSKANRDSKWADLSRKIQKFHTLKHTPNHKKAEFLASFGKTVFIETLTQQKLTATRFDDYQVNTLNDLLLADQQIVLPGDMLTKVDMMSMRHSLEVRTPFLDPEVVAFANQLPETQKTNLTKGKVILRNAFQDLLPKFVFERPKKGFEAPIHKWIFNRLPELKQKDFFNVDFLQTQALFHPSTVKKLLQDFENKKYPEVQFHFWSYLVFQEWYTRNQNIINA